MAFDIRAEDIKNYIEDLGFRPACPTLCIDSMRREYNLGKRIFDFYVNVHNLCWYADETWKAHHPDKNEELLKVSLRDFKLNDILSN